MAQTSYLDLPTLLLARKQATAGAQASYDSAKEYVDSKLAELDSIQFQKVDSLPSASSANTLTLYYVKRPGSGGVNVYHINPDTKDWEFLGGMVDDPEKVWTKDNLVPVSDEEVKALFQ